MKKSFMRSSLGIAALLLSLSTYSSSLWAQNIDPELWHQLTQQKNIGQLLEKEIKKCGVHYFQKFVFCKNDNFKLQFSPKVNLDFSPAPLMQIQFQAKTGENLLWISELGREGLGKSMIYLLDSKLKINSKKIPQLENLKGLPLAFLEETPPLEEDKLDPKKLDSLYKNAKSFFTQAHRSKRPFGLSESYLLYALVEEFNGDDLQIIQKNFKPQGPLAKVYWEEAVVNKYLSKDEDYHLKNLTSLNILTHFFSFKKLWDSSLHFPIRSSTLQLLVKNLHGLDQTAALYRKKPSPHLLPVLINTFKAHQNSYRLPTYLELISHDKSALVSDTIFNQAIYGQEATKKLALQYLGDRSLQDLWATKMLKLAQKKNSPYLNNIFSLMPLPNVAKAHTNSWLELKYFLLNHEKLKAPLILLDQIKDLDFENLDLTLFLKYFPKNPHPKIVELLFNFPSNKLDGRIDHLISHEDPNLRSLILDLILKNESHQEILRSALLNLSLDPEKGIRKKAAQEFLQEAPNEKELQHILQFAKKSKELKRLEEIVIGLSEFPEISKEDLLKFSINRGTPALKESASAQLAQISTPQITHILIDYLKDESEVVRLNVHGGLTKRELLPENFEYLYGKISLSEEKGMDLIIDLLSKDTSDRGRQWLENIAQNHKSAKLRKKANDELLYQSL